MPQQSNPPQLKYNFMSLTGILIGCGLSTFSNWHGGAASAQGAEASVKSVLATASPQKKGHTYSKPYHLKQQITVTLDQAQQKEIGLKLTEVKRGYLFKTVESPGQIQAN